MKEIKPYQIAVLVTCHNRKQKTLNFLESLYKQNNFDAQNTDVYLLDDGSIDGTTAAVNSIYPKVNIITGSGNLFWAGGMRTIWNYALAQKRYDIYFLFNDDIVLFEDAVEKLVKQYQHLKQEGVILVGSTISKETNKISYGGNLFKNLKHCAYYRIEPDPDKCIPCHMANANILLVDKFTVKKIGIFPEVYTHCLADYDYTFTAFKSGIGVWLAPGFYAYCENDHGINWLPGSVPLKKRIEYLYSPKGLAYKEYLYYIRKHFPSDYTVSFIKLWLKTFFSFIWDKFKPWENH